jgi:hypothetical protein
MRQKIISPFAVVAFVALLGLNARAQSKNEVGLLLGGSIVPTSVANLNIRSGLAYQATYAHRFTSRGGIGLGLEVPFVALPSQDVQSASPSSPRNYASLFVTPGLRLTLAPSARVSPWASVGGGYARFAESTTLATGAANSFKAGTNKGALQYGGGADFKTPLKILVPLALRVEVRDFYTGQPRLNVARTTIGQHNVIVSGGLVVRF